MSRRVVAERQFAPLYLLLALLLLTFALLGLQSAKNKAPAAVFPDSLSQQDIKDIKAHVLRNKAQPIVWVRETNGEISVGLRGGQLHCFRREEGRLHGYAAGFWH